MSREELTTLDGLPLSSLVITHEAGYERLGGHTVHFKWKHVFYDKDGRLMEARAVLSVSRGQGMRISGRTQQQLNTAQ